MQLRKIHGATVVTAAAPAVLFESPVINACLVAAIQPDDTHSERWIMRLPSPYKIGPREHPLERIAYTTDCPLSRSCLDSPHSHVYRPLTLCSRVDVPFDSLALQLYQQIFRMVHFVSCLRH